MKLVTFTRPGESREALGLLREDRVLPLEDLGFAFADMNDLILRASKEDLAAMAAAEGEGLPLGDVTLLSPIPRPLQDVLCLGLNYSEHAAEAGRFSSEAFGVELAAPNELGVILGKDASCVAPEDVADYIFGYTIINDVSAREVQTIHKQWHFGKSLEGFCPMGPCILTADEVPFPPALPIWTTLNGKLRQNSNTNCLIHGIPEIVSTLSRGLTLKAGTIIATGTPKGVLMGEENPIFLQPGDEVVCGIDGIGELRNTVE